MSNSAITGDLKYM